MHGDSKVLVELSSFLRCSSVTNAGSLEYTDKGQIIQNKVTYFKSLSLKSCRK